MPIKRIITGQDVSNELYQRAKELRKGMTPAEKRLWERLRARRLDGWHFRRQQIIDRFIVDFYCHKADLVIEVDGEIHLSQLDDDLEREKHLRDLGLTVIRFSNEEVLEEIDGVLVRILDACRSAAQSGHA